MPLWTMCRPHNSSATPPIRSSRIIVPIGLLSAKFLIVIGSNGSAAEKVQFCVLSRQCRWALTKVSMSTDRIFGFRSRSPNEYPQSREQ
jgi:hypothetical protein